MLKSRLDIVRRVRGAVLPTEESAYSTLGQIGRLIHETCVARTEADLPLAMSQEPISILVGAVTKMGEVCNEIVLAHRSLAKGGATLVPEIAWGDTGVCPKQADLDGIETRTAPIRAVA